MYSHKKRKGVKTRWLIKIRTATCFSLINFRRVEQSLLRKMIYSHSFCCKSVQTRGKNQLTETNVPFAGM